MQGLALLASLLWGEGIGLGLLAGLVFGHFAVLAGNGGVAGGPLLGDGGKLLDLDGLVGLLEFEEDGLEEGLEVVEGEQVEEKGLRDCEDALVALQAERLAGLAVVFPAWRDLY